MKITQALKSINLTPMKRIMVIAAILIAAFGVAFIFMSPCSMEDTITVVIISELLAAVIIFSKLAFDYSKSKDNSEKEGGISSLDFS